MRFNTKLTRGNQKCTLQNRRKRIEWKLLVIIEGKKTNDCYSAQEVARILDVAEFTVGMWCRNGRIAAEKRQSDHGFFSLVRFLLLACNSKANRFFHFSPSISFSSLLCLASRTFIIFDFASAFISAIFFCIAT